MLTVRIQLEGGPLLRELTDLEQSQLPFATSLALNNLAKSAQQHIRDHYRQTFTLRRPDFIEKQGAKILRFANKGSLASELGIDPKADFLTKFQEGGQRPIRGQHIAIPVEARRNKSAIITTGQRPRQLLNRLGKKRGAGGVFRLTTESKGLAPGVYQRTGRKGRGGVKLLYAFETRAQIPPELQFIQIAERTAKDEWPTIFEEAMRRALKGAR